MSVVDSQAASQEQLDAFHAMERKARRWKLVSLALAVLIPLMGLAFSGISTSFQLRGVRALETIAGRCK